MERAAQAWCTPETSKTIMDPVLAKAFADILDTEIAKKVKAETARCVGNLTSAMGLDMAAYDALGIAVEEIVPPTVMRTWEIAIKALEAKE